MKRLSIVFVTKRGKDGVKCIRDGRRNKAPCCITDQWVVVISGVCGKCKSLCLLSTDLQQWKLTMHHVMVAAIHEH